jgi:hypothetical protein
VERWLALAVVLAIAGCGGPKQAPEGIPVDENGEVLPTLEGFVVDEAIRPMAGAQVRLLGLDIEASTDADGHYAILRPTLQAEAVLVSVSSPGYQARTQQAQVSGHRSTRLDFRLELDPYQMPHVDVLQQTDVMECGARTGVTGESEGVSCRAPNLTFNEDPVPPNVWVITPTPGFAGIVVEVHWDAVTQLSERLHVALRAPVAGGFFGELGEVQAEAEGTSPLRLEIPADVARTFSPWTAVHVEARLSDAQGAAPFAFTHEQPYDAYASLFYVDPAPPGYTLG